MDSVKAEKKEYMDHIGNVIENGPYRDDWVSLARHPEPEWLKDGRFGIFIHWGVYSVPAFGNEWYPRNMYDPSREEYAHHLAVYGRHTDFGYKDFIPMFRGQAFDADQWIRLFKQAGAKYIMPVAEHHDGFAMYETGLNRWNAKNMGPKRDVIGELKAAAEKEGLAFCVSTHRAEHYFFMNMGRTFESDVNDPAFEDFYGPAVYRSEFDSWTNMYESTHDVDAAGPDEPFLDDWMIRTCELVEKYRPSMLYFDWWIHNRAFAGHLAKIAAFYYNSAALWGKDVTIAYKHGALPPGVGLPDVERGALTGISRVLWQADTAVGKHSWGYTKENAFKSARQIIGDLIDIVSKNGTLLLNVGPKPDGTITGEETAVLTAVGEWLSVNGEGIYGTSGWKTFGEGAVNAEEGFFRDGEEKPYTPEDFRFTEKDGVLYVFQMRPDGADVRIRSLGVQNCPGIHVREIELLGYGHLAFQQNEAALRISMPAGFRADLPVCFRVAAESHPMCD